MTVKSYLDKRSIDVEQLKNNYHGNKLTTLFSSRDSLIRCFSENIKPTCDDVNSEIVYAFLIILARKT